MTHRDRGNKPFHVVSEADNIFMAVLWNLFAARILILYNKLQL